MIVVSFVLRQYFNFSVYTIKLDVHCAKKISNGTEAFASELFIY